MKEVFETVLREAMQRHSMSPEELIGWLEELSNDERLDTFDRRVCELAAAYIAADKEAENE